MAREIEEEEGGVIGDLVSALVPSGVKESLSEMRSEIETQLERIPNRLNEYGFDRFGMNPGYLRGNALPGYLMYRHYFRCEVSGAENVPEGRVLVIANHAGQLPFDGMMLSMALLLEAEPPRVARAMGEYFLPRVPGLGTMMARGGSMVGTPRNCVQMLRNEEAVVVFPEGARGMNKPYSERYKLQRFGLGFMRIALESDTPIVPVGIVGSDDQHPGFANLQGIADRFNLPALPITPTFPWLGPLGLLPMPVKYRIYFGEPLRFSGEAEEEDADIQKRVDVVKGAIDGLLARGLEEREGKGIFG